MTRVLIVGNSGSGKTTLAQRLCRELDLAHLDLDSLAWLPGLPPQRRPAADSERQIRDFTRHHQNWVIEGCYADLLGLLSTDADEIVFLKIPVRECIANARIRPFEPEKYSSEAAQNRNLEMLIQWIRDYSARSDSCSLAAHAKLFTSFRGKKNLLTSCSESAAWLPG